MMINSEYAIIMALIEDPMASEEDIRQKVSKIIGDPKFSLSTVNRKLKKLIRFEDLELLGYEFKKTLEQARGKKDIYKGIIHGVFAEPNYNLLDLQIHTFMIFPETANWKENIDLLSSFCDLHPYTIYQNTVFGADNALFCYFSMPKKGKAIDFLLSAFSILKSKKIILTFRHFELESSNLNYSANLDKWIEDGNRWVVDFEEIGRILNSDIQMDDREEQEIDELITPKLTIFDNIIIREMTKNARRSQSSLIKSIPKNRYYEGVMDKIPLSKQSLSRRVKFLTEYKVFKNYTLAYDRQKFGIFNQALYIIEKDEAGLRSLRHCIKNQMIPFPGSISISPSHYIFWINLPPIELIELTNVLTRRFPKIRTYLFGRESKRYLFWYDNFDPQSRYWKTNKEYIVDDVLKSILS